MNRIGIIIASIVAVLLGLGMCAVVAITQMSCCAIQLYILILPLIRLIPRR